MTNRPFFSIVIPLYNKENHIQNTLKTVLAQTFTDFEILVINDGSTDGSLNKAEQLSDPRIKIFTIPNQGVSSARNFGIQKASSELIAFLDADDTWYNHHLADLKNLYLKHPHCGLYCKAYIKQYGDKMIKSVYKNISITDDWYGIIEDYFDSSSINNIAWTSAVVVPKTVLTALNSFNKDFTGAGEDTDLWIRIALAYPVAFWNKPSAIHKLDADNRISNSNTNKRQFIILDEYEEKAKNNKSLKRYLDLNRFSIALQYKLVGNTSKARDYISKIDKNNLNKKQLFLLYSNPFFIKVSFQIKQFLLKNNIHISSYR